MVLSLYLCLFLHWFCFTKMLHTDAFWFMQCSRSLLFSFLILLYFFKNCVNMKLCNLKWHKSESVSTYLVFPCRCFTSGTNIAKIHVLNIIECYKQSWWAFHHMNWEVWVELMLVTNWLLCKSYIIRLKWSS